MSAYGSRFSVVACVFSILTVVISSTAVNAQNIAATQDELQDGIVYFNTGAVSIDALPNLLNDDAAVFRSTEAYVLMLDGPITPARRLALDREGVTLFDYLPKYAYVARIGDVSPARLRALGFVRSIADFRPEWKLDPELSTRVYTTPEMQAVTDAGRFPVIITVFIGGEAKEAIDAVAAIDGAVLHRAEPFGEWFEIAAELPADRIAELAELDSVQYIEPASELTFRNSSNRWIVQSNVLNVTPIYDNGIRGEGQIVGVIDGRAYATHCSLSGGKILFYNATSGSDTHGTHVSCTAVGNAGVDDNTRGVAYMGNMVFALIPSFNETAVNNALTLHANQGARLHTNSWGDDGTTSYNSMARGFDLFHYQLEDNLACLAVTNTSTLRNPENAKNLLAVGASQDTPSQQNHCSGGTGPTADGRRKPEIYAPGCNTTSASVSACGTTNLTGTSMACPAVAGTGALVRQYYVDGYYPSGAANAADGFVPSGALIKATLLNSAVDMTGITGYPSNQEGWGRVLADNALHFIGQSRKLAVLEDVRNANGLSTGQSQEYALNVQSNSQQLRVTLVWVDPPASANTGTAAAAVNNLNLEVESPIGQVFRGNVFSGGVSVTGGSFDNSNNVEQVHVNSPTAGIWTVRVTGANVAQGTQGYALIATGDVLPAQVPLVIQLPNGAPSSMTPGVAANVDVVITNGAETLVPGTAKLHYSYDNGPFIEAPLTPAGGDAFVATLPAALCANNPRYYFIAQGDGGTTVTSPSGAPGNFHTAIVGAVEIRFHDNFQTNQLWSVTNFPNGGGTFRGQWERGVPAGGGARGDPPTDYDGSGQCYLTENGAGDTDVDNGSTVLTSPAVNLTGLVTAEISYARWYSNTFGAAPQADIFTVQVSSNNGLSWTTLEVVGPTTTSPNPEVNGGWFYKTYAINGVVPLTSQFRVRFIADDAASGSVVEAAVDAVTVRGLSCEDPVQTPSAPTGVSATDGACLGVGVSWTASDGALFYEVWRNTVDAPGSATLLQSGVSGTTYDDASTAVGDSYYYFVSACNGSGCSSLSASDVGIRGMSADFNNDGIVDGADIQGFVEAFILDPFYDDCADLASPIGELDAVDIGAFVDILLVP